MMISGYLKPFVAEQNRVALCHANILLKDFKQDFMDMTKQLTEQIESSAAELGRPVAYLASPKAKKEDIAKDFLPTVPVDNGLICVLKTLEACRTAKLCRHLDGFAKSIHPFLDVVRGHFGQGYYWCVDPCKFATDLMFKERAFLEDIYPSLVGHAFYDFSCTDVFTFMGRKPNPRFQGEAVSDYKNRPVGCMVKFKWKSNSVKIYDKCSVLRIETTINSPKEFKACNLRFMDAMVDIVSVKSSLDEIGRVCSGKTVDGKKVPDLNVWSPEVVRIMETIRDGKYLVNECLKKLEITQVYLLCNQINFLVLLCGLFKQIAYFTSVSLPPAEAEPYCCIFSVPL